MNTLRLINFLPKDWIRFFGKLQFRVPWLRAPIQWVAGRIVSAEGVIQSGVGEGLRFRGHGGYPGYLLGTSEPLEQSVLAKSLEPGGVFYDIGANVGFYSTLAARLVGETGRVFAFEPFPESAEACRHNAALNGFSQVTVVEAAVDEKDGVARLEIQGSSAMYRLGEGGGLEVPVIGIDSWRAATGAPPPEVVMIDVEGAELKVLLGMLKTIEQARPIIMVEVHWLGEAFTELVEKHLTPLGYEMSTYDGETPPDGPVRYHALLRSAKGAGEVARLRGV